MSPYVFSLRQLQRLPERGIVAHAPDAAVEVVVGQAETTEKSEGQVGHVAQAVARNAVQRAEHEPQQNVARQALRHCLGNAAMLALRAGRAVAVAAVEPDEGV